MRYSFLLIAALLVTGSMTAQLNVTVTPNIASQPLWGPTGYDHARYYYLPDIETYYDVPQRRFYYYQDGRWIGRSQLPPRYKSYDFYHSYKVVIDDPKPYNNHKKYRDQYLSFKGRHGQEFIRDSHDQRYYVIKGHPEHNKWMKRSGSGNGRGHSKGINPGKKN